MARFEDARLPKCVMFGELVGGQEKESMGCFLDNLGYFGTKTGQWTTAAQNEGVTFHGETDRCRESQG